MKASYKYIIEIQGNVQWSQSKTVCGFSITLILKGIMTFQSQKVHEFC